MRKRSNWQVYKGGDKRRKLRRCPRGEFPLWRHSDAHRRELQSDLDLRQLLPHVALMNKAPRNSDPIRIEPENGADLATSIRTRQHKLSWLPSWTVREPMAPRDIKDRQRKPNQGNRPKFPSRPDPRKVNIGIFSLKDRQSIAEKRNSQLSSSNELPFLTC